MAIEPGTKVRVINPSHWLFDKVGHVVKTNLEYHIKKQMVGAAPARSVGVPVDFGRRHHGWYNTPLKGERRVETHNCDGVITRPHGYYVLERDLKIEDIPGGIKI